MRAVPFFLKKVSNLLSLASYLGPDSGLETLTFDRPIIHDLRIVRIEVIDHAAPLETDLGK